MHTRHASRWFWLALALVCLTIPFLANKAATQPQGATANVKTAGGLTVVTFTVNPGKIKVYLPDDMRAGDTISGTVVAEPNGTTKEERGANQTELNKFRISLFSRPEDKPEEVNLGDISTVFKYALIADPESGNVFSVGLVVGIPGNIISKIPVPVLPPTHPSGAIITPDPKITPPTHPSGAIITPDPKITPPTHPSGAIITPDPKITPPTHPSGAIITPDPKITPPTHPSGAIITPDPKITPGFVIPPLGQTGRPLVIPGPFDGNSANTTVGVGTEEDRENMGRFDVIAESPRKAVFTVPNNLTGPIKLDLTEGNTRITGAYRNVGVNLSAPKTNLLKGEKTTLTVQVSGLEGIKQPVPLTLECKGVITMEGGIYQPLMIQPSEVGADGRYTTTRGITGVQTGGWEATATVVTGRFNVWLQDDSDPNRLFHFNSFTGDYVFACGGGSCRGGSGGTSSQPPTGSSVSPPPVTLTGTGKPQMKGCIITLSHNAPDRRVFARLDACTKTGDASVETTSPKTKLNITDKNTADNTAPSPPPK